MIVILIQVLGTLVFLGGTAWEGICIRRVPEKNVAERASRICHLLFWSCLVFPGLLGFFYPGITEYDMLLGAPDLPFRLFAFPIGLLLLLAGLGLLISSNRSLVKLGRGTAAFLLTKQVVSEQVYKWTRNPMSLGYYLACIGIGLMAGSTVWTLGALLVVIPVHIFFLRYFEEFELELRYGKSYAEYKHRVPFLLPRFSSGS